jgi:hypothetical protein
MKAINLPVLPPIFPRVFPRLLAAPLIAGPADDVTFDRPSEAFDWNFEAVSDAFDAVSFAASVALPVVDDSNRRATLLGSLVDCRATARDKAIDMVRGIYAPDDRKRGFGKFVG